MTTTSPYGKPGKKHDRCDMGSVLDILDRSAACTLCSTITDRLRNFEGRRSITLDETAKKATALSFKNEAVTMNMSNVFVCLQFYPRWIELMDLSGYFSDYAENLSEINRKAPFTFPGSNTMQCDFDLTTRPTSGDMYRHQDGRTDLVNQRLLSLVKLHDPYQRRDTQQLFERRIDVTAPSFSLLRSWLQLCRAEHGDWCNHSERLLTHKAQFRVVDVHRRCVVMAPTSCQFAALSYVWGGEQFTASSHDLVYLPWYLPDDRKLSKTIVDAMHLCRKLGIFYLWVDALCIAQNPFQNLDKAVQIPLMDRIYRSAAITICAASSARAADGFLGPGHRQVTQNIFEFKGEKYAETQPRFMYGVDDQLWNWRAWTYQERLLSRRVLLIAERQVHWICQCDAWMESTISEPQTPGHIGLLHEPSNSRKYLPEWQWGLKQTQSLPGTNYTYGDGDSFFTTYELVVSQYTARRIGYPRDGLNGIKAVLNVLNETHSNRGPFLWGLPSHYFDFSLLWMPRSGALQADIIRNTLAIPSWSWAAWFNESSTGVGWDISHGFEEPSDLPAIEWFVLRKDGTSKPIASTQWNSPKKATVCGLRAEHASTAAPLVSLRLIGEDDFLDDFFLHFKTTVATLKISPKLPWKGNPMDDVADIPTHSRHLWENATRQDYHKLLDTADQCAGHILLSSQNHNRVGSSVELVFFSYAKEYDLAVEKPLELLSKTENQSGWQIVNAMLLTKSRKCTFFERQALAKVWKDAWLATSPEARWIVLG
jgi:hypothetical protein